MAFCVLIKLYEIDPRYPTKIISVGEGFHSNASLLGPTEHDMFSSFVNGYPHQLLMSHINQQLLMPHINQLSKTDNPYQKTNLQRPNDTRHEGFNLNSEQITNVFGFEFSIFCIALFCLNIS